MTDLEFIKSLQDEIDVVWKSLPDKNDRWNYAISATKLRKGVGIIFGINRGADNTPHEFPPDIPTDDPYLINYRFISKSKDNLRDALNLKFQPGNFNFNYSNLCFFRSKKVNELLPDYFKKSLPLFKMYVSYIHPPWLLALGTTIYKELSKCDDFKEAGYLPQDKRAFKLYYGQFMGIPIYILPHPEARVKGERREALWKLLKNQLNSDNVQP